MKILWRLSREAVRYRGLYVVAIVATLLLTLVNLAAPKVLTSMTAVLETDGAGEPMRMIWALTILLLVLYLLRVLFRFLSSYLSHTAAWHLVEEVRVRLYDRIQHFSMRFFHDKQTGDLMSRVVNDTAHFELLYAHIIPEMVTNIVTVVGVMAILLTVNVRLALLTCIPIPFILFGGWLFVHKIRPNFRVSQRALAELNAKLQDNFSGVKEIQAFGQQEQEKAEILRHSNRYTAALLHALKLSNIFHPGVEFVSSIGTITVVGVGGAIALGGGMSVSDVVAFLLYLSLFYTPISGLARLLEDAQQALAGAERVMTVLDTPIEIDDKPGAVDAGRLQGAVRFENVRFSYDGKTPVLTDVSFACEPGQMVALVGPTGVGKTTLTQLLPRFYEPDDGVVSIDGRNIQEYTLSSLRANIAPVLQDTFLFNGTVADNIRYANPSATDEQVVDAAKAARIHSDILAMPDGYATKVGERGMRLSGGQKQRIAIARAILRDAPIIILDEATASVDVETEGEIQQAIAELAGSRTVVAIAHRLSTIRGADLILVLEDGRIVQRGTHAQLMAQEGLYRRLNSMQERRSAD